MPPGTAQHKQWASQPLSSSKAHKAITCTCTTIKTPSQTCRAFLSVFFLTSSSSLSLSLSLLLPLILMLVFGPCQAITTCYISFCDFFDSPSLLDPSALLLLLLLLAIFHMQHATDVFMFCVCAAHKKINEPRGGKGGKKREKGSENWPRRRSQETGSQLSN